MRCAVYIRVSTQEQFEEGFSIPAQKERLRAFCKSQGWKIIEEYIEEGYSAKDTKRPKLQSMLKDLENGSFDIVLVYRLDRLTRSVLDLYKLMQTFEENQVSFKSATEVYDTSTAMGRLFITLVAALAEWERNNLAERVKFGTRQMAEQGIRPGSPRPYGYKYQNKKLVIKEDEAKWVKWIFEKYITTGMPTIAKELNQMGIRTRLDKLWTETSVFYILNNPLYAKLLRYDYRGKKGEQRVFNDEPIMEYIKQEDFTPIISEEDFRRTQALMEARKNNQTRSKTHYPFSSIIYCAECGHKYVGRTEIRQPNNREYRAYSCTGRRKLGICKAPSFSEEAMTKAFFKSLELTLDNPEIEIEQDIDPDYIEAQLIKLQGKKDRTKELYIEGEIGKKRYYELMEEYTEDESKLESAINEVGHIVTKDEIMKFLENLREEWNYMEYETQKKSIHTLFESITVKVIKKGTTGRNPQPAIVDIVDYKFR